MFRAEVADIPGRKVSFIARKGLNMLILLGIEYNLRLLTSTFLLFSSFLHSQVQIFFSTIKG
jgi:hypothetical protein